MDAQTEDIDGPIVIIGAGPAGLSAAHELVQVGYRPLVLEVGTRVGGIARTETFRGFHFDIGGHRFYTKLHWIQQLWEEMLGKDFLKVSRLSRIYYRGRFFSYPLKMANALTNLGLVESTRIVASFLRAQTFPSVAEETFEQWMINRFGDRLYRIFFKTYTEKVWGIPCTEIRADWAAQRIMGLSLVSVVSNALFGSQGSKTLVDRFHYPSRGPGMMWQKFRETVEQGGGEIRLSTEAVKIFHRKGQIRTVTAKSGDTSIEYPASHVISSMPINCLMTALEPAPPQTVLEAAHGLTYRALVLVGLIIRAQSPFHDQWIYVHSPSVKVGRIQNFKNWSAQMAPGPERTNVGMEYFCNKGDAIWSMPDRDMVQLATEELVQLGLAQHDQVEDGFVIRQPGAYPVYDQAYKGHLETIRSYLDGFTNLQTIGRNGMHRYNNMDHSMQTGILAARNIFGANKDIWSVNTDDAYLEERYSPRTIEAVKQTFSPLDAPALGTAVGSVCALLIFAATLWLVLKGGAVVGPNLSLLAQYFPGYSVTLRGTLIGAVYGFTAGFVFGWGIAALRNRLVSVALEKMRRKAVFSVIGRFFKP
ncbi:MAG: NAD(P)/FAD-dependent oxidoreductase [Desulfobacterales bacterium]|nr:NAD(P)/FAD-dependent oxidoreductase [Desulfobacterales bacterium]